MYKIEATSPMYWNGFVFYHLDTKTCYDINGNIITDRTVIKRAEHDYMYGHSVYRYPEF